MREPMGIYLHIPFCTSKCPYCDFYSLPASEEAMEAYTRALCHAIRTAPPQMGEGADTVYFGGGTPILLGARRVGQILDAVRERFAFTEGEVTLEANPHATLYPTLVGLREAGVNRLSFGLQSAVEEKLRLLGRTHTADEAAQAVEAASRAGFENISLDVMMGLPGQTRADLAQTLDFCFALAPQHLSAYLLKLEPGTPFAGRYSPEDVGDELQADLYLEGVKRMEAAGYRQYEISNFARPGYESRHNLKYWQGIPYIGIGPAAASLLPGGERILFPRDLQGFLQAENPWSLAKSEGMGGGFEEDILLGLRLTEGVSLAEAARRYPEEDVEALARRAAPLRSHGLLQPGEARIALTPQGMLLSNSVIAHLLG